MKVILNIFIIALLVSINFAIGQTTNIIKDNSQFFPMNVGNYWVYSNSHYPNRNIDTIKITKKETIGSDIGYLYNMGFLMERNDSVFQFQNKRNGTLYISLLYFPSDKLIRYALLYAGDTLCWRTMTKLKDSYKVKGKEYFNCYKFTQVFQGNDESIIISRGIGIIEFKLAKKEDRLLIDYKIE